MSVKPYYAVILVLFIVGFDCGEKGDPFLEETGETISKDSLGDSYRGLFMVIPVEYHKAIEAARQMVSSDYGIGKEFEKISEMSTIRFSQLSDIFERERKDRIEVENMGFCLDTIRQYEITSKKFNLIPSLDGYSEIEILVVDGGPILKKDYSFLAVKRFNDYWWWGREYHTGCPAPFKVNSRIDAITNTEMSQLKLKNLRQEHMCSCPATFTSWLKCLEGRISPI
jgi:hypothetical protein